MSILFFYNLKGQMDDKDRTIKQLQNMVGKLEEEKEKNQTTAMIQHIEQHDTVNTATQTERVSLTFFLLIKYNLIALSNSYYFFSTQLRPLSMGQEGIARYVKLSHTNH